MKLCPNCKSGVSGSPSRCTICAADLSSVAAVSGNGLSGMIIDGKYALVELLGEGGMAWVYKAIHQALEREVAVKILKAAPAGQREEQAARFAREARMASRLNHPHIVSIIDFGQSSGGFKYLVTEFIKGKTLQHALWEQRPLPVSRVLGIFHQVLTAIEEAHGEGVVHRDIKPENIIVDQLRSGDDFVKVLDFGIAVLAGRKGAKVTQDGAFIGTPGFMAPEQILGQDASERSDIYALGLLLFEMLAGRAAYEAEAPLEVMTKQLNEETPRLSELVPERGLPEELDRVIARATAREPEQRYGSVAELRAEVYEAFAQMSVVELDCAQCSRPVDPTTGLCALHSHGPAAERAEASGRQLAQIRADIAAPTVRTEREPRFPIEPEAFAADGIVGRTAEHAAAARFLAGSATSLSIVGDVGMGKTTLADDISRACEEQGFRVLRAGPDPRRSATPWYPVRELVGQALGIGPEPAARDELGRSCAARGVDEQDAAALSVIFGFADGPAAEREQSQRDRLHEAAVRAMDRAVDDDGPGPLLVVEDLHEFDRASFDLLRATGALGAGQRLKLVVTANQEQSGWAGDHQILELEPLAPQDSAALADRLLAGAPERVRTRMRSAIEKSGNPIHAVLAAQVVRDGGEPIGSLDAVLAARLELLPSEELVLLRAVSMLGERVTAGMVRAVLPEDQLFFALDSLLRRGLLRSGENKAVSPTSPAVARAALEGMTGAERRGLAHALWRHFEDEGGSVYLRARLADEAKEHERAVELLEQAGDAARRVEATEDAAMTHYRRAVHLARWELLLSEEDEKYLELSLKLGRALQTTGHRRAAEVVFKEVAAAAKGHPDLARRAREGLGTLT